MKSTKRYIMIVTALLFVFTYDGVLQAQTTGEMASKDKRLLAVPIQVVGAQSREVPSSFMHKLAKGEESRSIEVLDLSIKVDSHVLDAFPPSLQPYLYIGGKTYPVQRVEYSNWDLHNEKPIYIKTPIGVTQTIHFFIEDWDKVEPGQPMIFSVLSPEEMKNATGGQYTVEQLNRIMPELKKQIPLYAPREFIKLEKEP